ncbi:hypothetical protein MIMGU_mgv11b020207mg [Erythranthe guttata]|uniref:X8 domain-containing protein n=1 Tax=Erythranthe guttata TaxID=4155 RepID=A0A022QFP2_ERYGU|nr:hypothetical protein MIMGU_mgv11b020207mg [Erythranthe guttata]
MNKFNVPLFLVFCLLVLYMVMRQCSNQMVISQANALQDKLQGFIDYGCGVVDCSAIQLGGPCYDPDTVVAHASYVLDLVYKKQNSCNTNLGIITTVDPSYGS